MSAEKFDPASCLTTVHGVFSDLRSSEGELTNFLGDMFDQLESISLELFARHKCLELTAQHQTQQEAAAQEREGRFREWLQEVRSLEAKAGSTYEEIARVLSEVSETHQQFLREHLEFREAQEELRRIGTECRAMREAAEQDRVELRQLQENVRDQLQRLATAASEWAAPHPQADRDEQLAQVLEAMRRQEAAWQHDRVELEAELEAERQRAHQQNETVAEQRRLAAQQQGELAGELKRMRSLLEVLSNHMNQPFGANVAAGDQASMSSEDTALSSMLAQFEMLQRDLAQRKAGRQKNTAKS